MTNAKPSVRGNALPIVLLVVVLAAIGVAGWYYATHLAPKDEVIGEVGEMTADAPPVMESSMPQMSEESAPPETTAAEATEGVAIDVAKATGVRAMGNPDAPIKMIEYASLTCSHCAHFHNDILPDLKSKYIDTGKVYLEFREFPLNDPALKATLTARCLPEDKYESFVSLLFKNQEQWAGGIDYMAALKQNAKLAGMSDATFEACQAEPMLKLKIAENMQEAKDKWNINATPTFIINDGAETISGAQPLENFERVFRKITDGAVGEAPAVE